MTDQVLFIFLGIT